MEQLSETSLKKSIQTHRKKWLAVFLATIPIVFLMEFIQLATMPEIRSALPEGLLSRIHWLRVGVLTVLLFALNLWLTELRADRRLCAVLRSAWTGLTENGRNTLLHMLTFAFVGAAAFFLLSRIIPSVVGKPWNWVQMVFCLAAVLAAASLFTFRKTLGKKPEIFFLIFTLLAGGLMSFLMPSQVAVSWDDGYHYHTSNHLTYLGYEVLTDQDFISMDHTVGHYTFALGEARDTMLREEAANYEAGAEVEKLALGAFLPTRYWYLASALGLYLGRALRLSYALIWSLGRFFNLLAYAVIGYFAIRRLRSGKMILTSVLMIPLAVFLASQYSYDPGVTAFTALGLAYCFGEWQEPEKKLTWYRSWVMIGALFLGCLIKAIYFPLLLMPLFLPRSKFENDRHRRRFFTLTLLAMVAVIGAFMIPFVLGSGEGDTRGGSDVNAFGQIAYIFANPLEYTETLLTFIRDYIKIDSASDRFSFFAYMGRAPYSMIYLVELAVAAFTDWHDQDLGSMGKGNWLRWLMLFLLFGTLSLVATSMFVSYTPVGARSIGGCQPRYLMPLYFPAMIFMGTGLVKNRMSKTVYNGILFSVIGFVNFASVLTTCVSVYG